jgi:hypothetical protein
MSQLQREVRRCPLDVAAIQPPAKEQIPTLSFPRQPLQLEDEERSQLHRTIERAMRLGNNEHGKCRILFEDSEGLKYVETTIWSADADRIVLKYGMHIPIARIRAIEMP